MWVVKIGGSLASSPELARWLAAVSGPAKAPVVVVPGGGPYADLVRQAQTRHGFDNEQAHRMAILAMEQYGHMLCALEPRLAPAGSVDRILATQAAGRVPVWMAAGMALAASDIAASWDVTSDSLAAWLAHSLGASALFLVKSASPDSGRRSASAASLARSGFVDVAFPKAVAGSTREFRWLGPGDHAIFAAGLRDGAPCGTVIADAGVERGVDNARGHG